MIDFVNLPQTEVQMIAEYLKKHPKTNADRIRSMTDEELADLLWETVDGAYYQIENFMSQPSKGWWLEWLRIECAE